MAPRLLTTAEGVDSVFSNPPIATTGGFWQGLYVDHRWEPASEIAEVASPWHAITLFTDLPDPPVAERRLDGQLKVERVYPGDIVVLPAYAGHGCRWNAPGGFLTFVFEPETLAETFEGEASHLTLRPQFATQDLLVFQVGLAFRKLLQQGQIYDSLYAESLAQTLGLHLLQHYGTVPVLKTYGDGLAPAKLKEVIDYIEAHLDQALSLNQLAALVDISPHYFSELFKLSTGLSPHQYVIRCRVNRAKALLKGTQEAIAAIAYQVGFANQSHLNRHFKRVVGVTPRQFRGRC